jgi:hypothetical protein
MSEFLTYLHARPNAKFLSDIFYVGKGSRKRMNDFVSNRNPHYKNVVAKHGKNHICTGFFECSTEQNALDLEKGLIKSLKASGVMLVNMTNGGEGVSGWKMPEHQKRNMIEKLKGRVAPNKGVASPLKGRSLSDSHKQKLSKAKAGKIGSRKGAKLDVETKIKISTSQQGFRWVNNGVSETKGSLIKIKSLLASGFIFGRLSANRAQPLKEI